MSSGSAYGAWDVEHGLPVFRETLHPSDRLAAWDPLPEPTTDRHWCAFGNRRLQVVADNLGTVSVRDTAHGFRWLTPSTHGTGATTITSDGALWATDRDRWPASWVTVAPVRTWGPMWVTLAGEHEGLRIERTVGCPDGESAVVLVRVSVTAQADRAVELGEVWELTSEARIDSFDPCERAGDRLVRRVELRAGEPLVWWLRLGLAGDADLPTSDPEAWWRSSVAALAARLPAASCEAVPALRREVPWHAALLTGGACIDAVLGGHTLDQGSTYSFTLGFNGAARDPLQHALPLVYTEPDLALSVLRNTCAWAGPDGELPYAIDDRKQPVDFGYQPSDQALWTLWLAAEYAAATGDLDGLRAAAPFHPCHGAPPVPLVDHLVGQFRHLVDVVGVGTHGHLRIRNADWNDSALTLAPIERSVMQEHGESVLNSAMAAWVLPRFAGLLRRLGDPGLAPVADEADERAARWRELVAGEWNGRWYRRAHGPEAVVGDDELWLEVQPWAILCGAAGPDRAAQLLGTIDEVLRAGSPLGARLRGPAPIRVPEGRIAGEGSAGGVWFSVNMTLAWAAAATDPALAWDELSRMTLATHTAAYPEIWEGTLSGPDAYNTPESPRPGRTWAWPGSPVTMQAFPVNNLHAHAQVLLTYLRLLGVEPATDGSLRVGAGGGTFTSPVLELYGDGRGRLRGRGPVRVVTAAGDVVEGGATVVW